MAHKEHDQGYKKWASRKDEKKNNKKGKVAKTWLKGEMGNEVQEKHKPTTMWKWGKDSIQSSFHEHAQDI